VRVEVQRLRGEGLGLQDDLAGVAGEVFHHVVDGFQDRDVVILNAARFGEGGLRSLTNHRQSLGDGTFQALG